MREENKLIIEQLNKFGRVPQTSELLQMIKQLEDNWNKLKEYIGIEWYSYDNESVEFEVAKSILNKMQELEQGSDNNEQ